MTEVWRLVVGWERAYSVSSQGAVWSHHREMLLSQIIVNRGYHAVNLYLKGCKQMRKVHQLVAEAFIGPRPEGCWCLHLDDDKANNRVENLYWGTPTENSRDCMRNGHRPDQRGSANYNSKLNEADVVQIRHLMAKGCAQAEIARAFGVSRMLITRIKQGKAW